MRHLMIAFTFLLTLASTFTQAEDKPSYSGLGRESLPAEKLKEFAPPALPPELSRKIQQYFDIRSPGMGLLDPKGQHMYFSWSVTGYYQVWRLDQPLGYPVQMTGGEDTTMIRAVTPDGKYLVISRDRNGEENPGLYLQAVKGGPLEVIQHQAKVQTVFQFVSQDSHFIYYRANDIEPDSYAIYRYDYRRKKKELLFSEKGLWNIFDHRPDGRLLLSKHTGSTTNEIFEWQPKNKKLIPIIGQGEKQEFEVQFAREEGAYLVITPKDEEFRRLYYMKNKKRRPLTPPIKHDVSGLAIDDSRRFITYSINEDGYTRLRVLDAKTLRPIKIPIPADADHVYTGWRSHDGWLMTLGFETAKAPRLSYIYNFKNKKLTQWNLPSHPEVNTETFAVASLESYPARDGTKIPMFVRRPPQCPQGKEKHCPVVVHFHGGPESQAQSGFHVNAQLFVDEGFIFMEPNVRGSDGYGQTWFHSDDGPKRLQVITDIEDAARFVRTSWGSQKVGITGGSYGGYSTLYGMTRFAGAYDAGVAIVGMSNLLTFLQNTAPYRRALRISEYGDPEKDREALIELSPMTHLSKVQSPLLIIQGASDPRVPAGEAVQIFEALRAKNLPAGLILFADEGHGSAKRSNRVLEMGHTLLFFKKHLKGE